MHKYFSQKHLPIFVFMIMCFGLGIFLGRLSWIAMVGGVVTTVGLLSFIWIINNVLEKWYQEWEVVQRNRPPFVNPSTGKIVHGSST